MVVNTLICGACNLVSGMKFVLLTSVQSVHQNRGKAQRGNIWLF